MRVRRFKARRQHRVSAIELLESRCLLTGPGDFVGDTLAVSTNLGTLAPGGFLFENGAINAVGDLDVFQFQASSDGPATFRLNANSSSLDSVVTLLDSSGNFLATNDDFKLPLTDSLLTYAVHAGATYYIEASGFQSSTGGYSLAVSLPAVVDLGVLTVTQPQIHYSNRIDVTGDIDVFQIEANSPCLITVQLDAAPINSLDPLVTLLDSTGTQLQRDDDNGVGLNSFLTYSITGNQTYYLVASGVGASTGDYTLTVSRPPVTNLGLLTSAQPVLQAGRIAVVGESDFYRFQAQTTGFALVELSASEFSDLDTIVTVLDSNGAFLTFNDDIDFPVNSDSSLSFGVVAGRTYFIQAEGFVSTTGDVSSSTGDYSLSVSLPMTSNLGTLTSAQSLQSDGAIAFAGESDFYRIQAAAGGILVLELNPSAPQTLDTIVTLRNSSDNVVASNDDVNFPSQTNSRLTYIVSANTTYFIEASGFGISTGGYHLNASLVTDNISDLASVQTAFNLGTLSSARPLQATNAIETPLDRDVFQFRVDNASLVDIQLNALEFRTPDTVLRVLDSSGTLVASNDDLSSSNTNSRLSFSVQANHTYFIEVSGFGTSVGTYSLSASVIPVQSINSIAFPTPNTPIQVSGTIGAVGVISQFRNIVPAVSNQVLRIEVNAANSSLDPVVAVRVLSATGVVTSTFIDDDSGPGLNSLLSVSVMAGQFLEIDVRGFGVSTGAFSLTISAAAANNNFTPLNNNLTQTDLRFGSISQPYEQDVFRFTAASTGQVVIDLVAANQFFDPVLTVVRNMSGAVVGSNDDSPFNFPLRSDPRISSANVPVTSLNSHLEINVTANETYDIFARDFSFHTGSYFLAATQVTQIDDFVDTFDALIDLRGMTARRNIQFNDRHEVDPVITGRITAATANRGAQDIDLLDFQPNFTGVLDLTINRDPGLTVAMSVFRDIQQPGAGVGDYELVDVLMPGATTLSIPVDAMGIYVVRVVGMSEEGRSYRLSGREHTDPVPDSIATTEPIEFNAPLTTPTQAIDFAHDRDVYRFVAPSAGLVSVSLSQTTGSRLDPLLTILDNKGVPIASNDDVNFGAGRIDSLVTFQAVAGVVYYIQAEGIGATFGNYSLAVTPANLSTATARPTGTSGDSDIERALLEAATTGLLSIANGAGMNGDRSPTAIRDAIVEAIATLAKQGKLSSNYIVLILDDAPEAGFVLTDGLGMQTIVRPDSGVTLPPGGGIVNRGDFAVVAIVPTTGVGVPTLQVSGFGSNLGSSFQASMVMRSGESQSLPQQLVSRSTAGDKVQLTFSLGFDVIANRSVPAGQTPSFFLMTNAFSKTSDRSVEGEVASVVLANTDIEENLRTTLSFDPLDPEAWQSLFEGVLQNLQFEGLPRASLGNVLNRLRVSQNTVPSDVVKNSPVLRSAKAVYEVLKQGAGWIGNGSGQRKTPAPNPKPRTPAPKVTQETPVPRIAPPARISSKKLTHLGG